MKVIDRWHRRRDGTPKATYNSVKEAEEANPDKRAYLCPTCYLYHVSGKKKWSRSSKREQRKFISPLVQTLEPKEKK